MLTLSVKQIQELDKRATTDYGIPSLILMENAGREITICIERILEKQPKTTHVLVFCGGGNNGGDGFVVARQLFQKRIPVQVILLCDPTKIKGDAKINFHILKKMRIPLLPLEKFEGDWKTQFSGTPLILVDAILGTGFKNPLKTALRNAIQLINSLKNSHNANVRTLSIDIPSGLCGDEGPLGEAVIADDLITFVAMKTGLTNPQSKKHFSRCLVADIGIPSELKEEIAARARNIENKRN